MLTIIKDLGSLEAAKAFNESAVSHILHGGRGCIAALACVKCYHVIGDSTCLCAGFPSTCPKCGDTSQAPKRPTTSIDNTWRWIPIPSADIVRFESAPEDYSI